MNNRPNRPHRLRPACCPLRRRQLKRNAQILRLAPMGLLATLATVSSAAAQPPASADEGRETAPPSAADSSSQGTSAAGSKKFTLDDTFTVEGTLEKPSAFYILRRSALDYDWARLDARLSPLVLESVQDPLF